LTHYALDPELRDRGLVRTPKPFPDAPAAAEATSAKPQDPLNRESSQTQQYQRAGKYFELRD
jgi:hypothetical protein